MPTTHICPACGLHTNETACPSDGVSTVKIDGLQAESSELKTGDIVGGRYRIERVLGRGGFGAVYLARHTGTRQLLALKMMLRDTNALDDEDIRRFYREAEVTASLRHPNTVRVFDVGQAESGALFIAMEYLDGHTIDDLMRNRIRAGHPLQEAEIVEIAVAVLGSLAEAHSRGLVHRDLKPGNIMVSEVAGQRVVKVLDFGIVKTQGSDLTGTQAAIGTPAFMSPEQCMAEELDGRSDLYALGVILYLLVAHRVPFAHENPMTIMFQHCSGIAAPLEDRAKIPVSAALLEVINQLLEKAREARPESAATLRDQLSGISMRTPSPGPALSEDHTIDLHPVPKDLLQDHVTSAPTMAADALADLPSAPVTVTVSDNQSSEPDTDAYGADKGQASRAANVPGKDETALSAPAKAKSGAGGDTAVVSPAEGAPADARDPAEGASAAGAVGREPVDERDEAAPLDEANPSPARRWVAVAAVVLLAAGLGWQLLGGAAEAGPEQPVPEVDQGAATPATVATTTGAATAASGPGALDAAAVPKPTAAAVDAGATTSDQQPATPHAAGEDAGETGTVARPAATETAGDATKDAEAKRARLRASKAAARKRAAAAQAAAEQKAAKQKAAEQKAAEQKAAALKAAAAAAAQKAAAAKAAKKATKPPKAPPGGPIERPYIPD